jgi:photosystem II stability/assembly factor-like uncharacterized protein
MAGCASGFAAQGLELEFETVPLQPRSRIDALAYLGNGVVMAGTRKPDKPGHIHKSTDYGRTWTLVGDITGEDFITCLAAGEGGEAYLLTGRNAHVWRSTDYGDTWTDMGEVSNAYNGHFANAYGLHVTSAGTVLVADAGKAGGRIHRSEDRGETWQSIGPLDERALYRFMTVGDGIVVNGWAGHVYKSTDDGKTWADLGQLEDAALYAIEFVGQNTLLMGSENGVVHRSQDNGVTWARLGSPGAAADDFAWLGGTNILYSTYNGDRHMHLSKDAGETWQDLGPPPTPEETDWLDHVIYIADGVHRAVVGGTNKGYILFASLSGTDTDKN